MTPGDIDALRQLILRRFPPVNYGFAYGSGVFDQPGLYDNAPTGCNGPMLDMIFVVDDPLDWHGQNLASNPVDYAGLATLGGPRMIDFVARRIGAGVYFNPLVPLAPNRLIKYGVVSASNVLDDLQHWSHLYVAGRLHKPVMQLQSAPQQQAQAGGGASGAASAPGSGGCGSGAAAAVGDGTGTAEEVAARVGCGSAASSSNSSSGGAGGGAVREGGRLDGLTAALEHNQQSALLTALLLSPEMVSSKELLRRIVALSYTGDVRMGLAEDNRKVERIVEGSYEKLWAMYEPLLQQGSVLGEQLGLQRLDATTLRQSISHEARTTALSALPAALLARVAIAAGLGATGSAAPQALAARPAQRLDVAAAAARSGRYQRWLVAGLHHIVRTSSARQAVAGVLSAGAARSFQYLARKLTKAWR